jgi:DnaJ-class molecular chaperone
MRDPYDILGVPRTATEADVKKAYRKLAKAHHPDRNANDPKAKDKFAEITSANEILGDAEKRAKFDRGEIDAEGKPRFQGFEGFTGRRGGGKQAHGFEFEFPFGAKGARGAPGGGAGGGPEDIFSHLFGEGFRSAERGQPRSARGEDLAAELTVTLEDVAQEAKKRITLPTGRDVDVVVPKGVSDGQTIRLRGLGRGGWNGGDAGDLLLTIRIAPHDRFAVEGVNLRVRQPVDLEDAILGATIRVPTLTGSVDMKIPPMTSSGRTFRLRGKGLPAKGATGDLLVTTEIRLPEDADEALLDYARSRRAARAV